MMSESVGTVLIVDDCQENLQVLHGLLAQENFRVRVATSGQKALDAVKLNLPDLVLLDICMPEMDGYEVCRQLKSNSHSYDIPVLFISALSETDDIIKGFAVGGQDYITKPFQAAEVLARVRTHINLYALRRQLQQANQQLQQEIEQKTQVESALTEYKNRLEDLVVERSAELAESEYRFRTLVEQAADAIFLRDSQGQLVDVNHQACESLGYSREELLTMMVDDFEGHYSESWPEISNDGHLSSKIPVTLEAIHRRKDGSEFPVEIRLGMCTLKMSECPYVLALVRDISERKESQRQIEAYQGKLQDLVSQLTLSEEEERKRLAVELHDSICQTLAFMKMKVDLELSTPVSLATNAFLTEFQKNLIDVIHEAKSLTNNLGTPMLHEYGLKNAIEQWMATEIRDKHGIEVLVTDDQASLPLSEETQALLFRAVRELSVNVVKHALAKHITVSLRRKDAWAVVRLSDDGVGFEVAEHLQGEGQMQGYGLFSIKERIDHLGGAFEIQSDIGQGTRVVMKVPLLQSDNAVNGVETWESVT